MSNWSKKSSTSERLKEAMRIRHLKQADLARATGLAKGGISNYVTGRYEPKSDVISKLAKALNCSEMWLWGYDVPMERQSQKDGSSEEPRFTESEVRLILAYRSKPEMQHSVNLLLGIQDGADIVEDMVQTIKGTKKIQI